MAARILLVDDRRSNLLALEAILEPLGQPLVNATSGDEALKHLLDGEFAVILMDVQMAGLDGYQTAAIIKARERTRHIPIIFLTAINKDPAHVFRGYSEGGVDYILKPFDPHILRSKVSVFVDLFLKNQQLCAQTALLAARAEADVQRAHLHSLLMQAPAVIAIFHGPDHVVQLANPLSRRLVGDRDVVGKPVRVAAPELAGQPAFELFDRVYQTGEPFQAVEFPLRFGDDQRYFSFVLQPTRDSGGAVDGVMAHAIDVSELVRARKQQEALADRLREALQARDEFLSLATHELRTPLTSLQLTVQGLLRGAARGDDPNGMVVKLKMVESQVRRQVQLVEELLDVSRIAAGRLELQPSEIDLAALAREVAARFADELGSASCELRLHAPPEVVGLWDRLRIDQLLTNLLSNAVKYGPGKPIDLTIGAVDGTANISVSDQGIGIAAADQARLFERFSRAVAGRDYSGFGLGLWISRQIVEASGGTIRVTSEPGVGSTFTVELPSRKEHGAA